MQPSTHLFLFNQPFFLQAANKRFLRRLLIPKLLRWNVIVWRRRDRVLIPAQVSNQIQNLTWNR